jgi:tRNA (guanine-N7-)-methyltransferase
MTYGLARGRKLDVADYGIEQLPPYEAGRIDPRSWFARPQAALEIEIGCGKGTFLVQEAEARPDVSFLGIEKAGEFFRYAADRMRRRALTNVRVLRADAVEFLRYWCADAVADVVHLLFSDPWPKGRHHKRRVIQDETLPEIHRVLAPDGELHLVTDHEGLWTWYQEHVARHEKLFARQPFSPMGSAAGGELVGTNYERKYRNEGRRVHAMTLRKRG